MSGRRLSGGGMTLLILLLPFVLSFSWLEEPDPEVEKGNAALRAGQLRQALLHYEKAQQDGRSAAVELNIGISYYRLALASEDQERESFLLNSERALAMAAASKEPRVRALANYNLGNLHFRRERFDEAIASYRRALIADPGLSSARYNLELALRRLADAPEGGSDQEPGTGTDSARRDPSAGDAGADVEAQDAGVQQNDDAAPEAAQDASTGREADQDPVTPSPDAAPLDEGDRQEQGPDSATEPSLDSPIARDERERESWRKLDKLERRSRELRRRRLRGLQSEEGGVDW